MNKKICAAAFLLMSLFYPAMGQEKHHYQTEFTKEEFAGRRLKIMESIGNNAIALIQGSSGIPGFSIFRQSNTFYYLTGLETPHAYLLIRGYSKRATLYLPHRDEGTERGQGKVLSAEDTDLVKQLTAVEDVRGIEFLSADLIGTGLIRPPAPVLYTEFSPAENGNDSRDELLYAQARTSADPWDGQPTRESLFIQKLHERVPQFEVRDLSPTLDAMRVIKSAREVEVIRKSTQIAGLGIMEAMRSTQSGLYEFQLDAVAKYIFYLHNARGDAYPSIIGGGTNTYMGHYFHKTDKLVEGDLVIMDYAPDYKYYTSDVTRIWPVNGKYTNEQKALTIIGNTLVMVKAGRVIIKANQAGNDAFNAAPEVSQSFCIKPAKPTITINQTNTEAATLTSSATTGNRWFLNGTPIPTGTNMTFLATAAGVYKVQVTVDDCVSEFSTDAPVMVTGDLAGYGNSIMAYPNPVETYFELSGIEGELSNVQLFDLAGRRKFIEFEKRGDVYRASVQHLAMGAYLLQIQQGSVLHSIKVIKK